MSRKTRKSIWVGNLIKIQYHKLKWILFLESFDQALISLCNRVTNRTISKVACKYTSNGSWFECECALDFVLFVFQSLMWLKILAVDKWKLIRRVQFRFHCKSMFWYVCVSFFFLFPFPFEWNAQCEQFYLHLSLCVIACMYICTMCT